MLYVLIDTNIFMRAWTQGRPGCEMARLRELKTFAEQKVLRLLLPEMVKLEVEKHWRSFPQDLGDKVGQVQDALKALLDKTKVWSEIEDVKPSLAKHLAAWKDQKRKECEERYKEVQALLSSEHFETIPLTNEIILSAKKRLISGRMPQSSPRDDQDACIVESLVAFFKAKKDKEAILYFCSENADDFAVELADKKGYALHPLICNDLPKSCFFTDLASTAAAAKEHKPPPEPTPKELEQAVELQQEKHRAGRAAAAAVYGDLLRQLAAEQAAVRAMLEPYEGIGRQLAAEQAAVRAMLEPYMGIGRQLAAEQAAVRAVLEPYGRLQRQLAAEQVAARAVLEPYEGLRSRIAAEQAVAPTAGPAQPEVKQDANEAPNKAASPEPKPKRQPPADK